MCVWTHEKCFQRVGFLARLLETLTDYNIKPNQEIFNNIHFARKH